MATNCQEEFESVVLQINIKTDVYGHTNPKSVILSHFYISGQPPKLATIDLAEHNS